MSRALFFFSLCILFISCRKEVDTPEQVLHDGLSGGETSIFSSGPDAYTFPLANLDGAGVAEHFIADGAFGQQFVSAPATQFGGVGPVFNQNSCESCHIRNGRGSVPEFNGDQSSGLLLRISVPGVGENNGIMPVPGFGGQLQNKAIFGVEAEGVMSKSEVESIVQFVDGNQVTLSKPSYTITDPYIALPAEVMISPRLAPPVFGLGLIEAISDEDILANVDEIDADGDGISGRVNMVWDILGQSMKIGRYGWKAEEPTAEQQAAGAAHNDMGLTSFYFPSESCDGQSNCEEGTQEELDIDAETVGLMSFYFETLAVPAQRNMNDDIVLRGREIFNSANCSGCHTPSFETGIHDVDALSNQSIAPFTDLLLHDMGEGLTDNRPTYSASGTEWRTAPLWGIGLTQVVNSNATFLHDGRASTLEEAILWHGGEAEASKEVYRSLSESDRNAVIAFLNSL